MCMRVCACVRVCTRMRTHTSWLRNPKTCICPYSVFFLHVNQEPAPESWLLRLRILRFHFNSESLFLMHEVYTLTNSLINLMPRTANNKKAAAPKSFFFLSRYFPLWEKADELTQLSVSGLALGFLGEGVLHFNYLLEPRTGRHYFVLIPLFKSWEDIMA